MSASTAVADQLRRRRLAQLVVGLRAELVLALGERHRGEIESLNTVQLLAARNRLVPAPNHRGGEAA